MGSKLYSKLKSVDFYKKIPSDLVEATVTGAWLSIAASVLMSFLLIAELSSFLQTNTKTELIVDRSPQNEMLRINFNISLPALSCEFASVDISDALGTKRMNLTKTVHKTPIDWNMEKKGATVAEAEKKPGPKYDEEGSVAWPQDVDVSKPINHENFQAHLDHYPVLVVNFYAPWCHWCQRLEPTWEAASKEIHDKYPEWDGRIRFVKVDCTQEMQLCRDNTITGFPSIRVFRKGHDDIYIMGMHDHEAYTGDRTKEALIAFADSLVPSAGMPHAKVNSVASVARVAGCNLAGFVMVKKVPGTVHFTAHAEGHSFNHNWMNMSHVVHSFYYGALPTPRKYLELKRLHPRGLNVDWLDKLQGAEFYSQSPQDTHEHYMQVVTTTVLPKSERLAATYDAYEYTAHSHTYASEMIPSVKFTYDLSPIQIVVKEIGRPWYHFLTTTCAIIGGVFTVAGILDSILYASFKLAKKMELGKQT